MVSFNTDDADLGPDAEPPWQQYDPIGWLVYMASHRLRRLTVALPKSPTRPKRAGPIRY